MNSAKPLQWGGIGLGLGLALYFAYRNFQYFGDISFLGADFVAGGDHRLHLEV